LTSIYHFSPIIAGGVVGAVVLLLADLDRLELPGSGDHPPDRHRRSGEPLPPQLAEDLDVGFVRVGPLDVEDGLLLRLGAGSRVRFLGPAREIAEIPALRPPRPTPEALPRDVVSHADLLDAPIGVLEQLQGPFPCLRVLGQVRERPPL